MECFVIYCRDLYFFYSHNVTDWLSTDTINGENSCLLLRFEVSKKCKVAVTTIVVTLSWDTLCSTHIPRKSCAPFLLNYFMLLWCQLTKTNVDRVENITTVPTNVIRIVLSMAKTSSLTTTTISSNPKLKFSICDTSC